MPRIFPVFDEIEKAVTPMGKGGGPAPQNLTAVPQESNIYVSWDLVYGAVYYIVYRNVSPDFATATVIANPVETSYTDMSITPGQTYYYWVAASPGAYYPDSDATGPATATVQLPPPAPPENLTALAGDVDIYVSWNAVTDAASYVLYRNLSPDLATALLLMNPTGTSYTDTDVLAGHTYYYWVAARNEAGNSDAVGPATATLPETVPEPIPEPTPPEEGFAPGDNIRRIMEIVRKRLDEIQKDKAAGKWPPWGWP